MLWVGGTCSVGSDDGGEVGHGAERVSASIALEVVQQHAVDATHSDGGGLRSAPARTVRVEGNGRLSTEARHREAMSAAE